MGEASRPCFAMHVWPGTRTLCATWSQLGQTLHQRTAGKIIVALAERSAARCPLPMQQVVLHSAREHSAHTEARDYLGVIVCV